MTDTAPELKSRWPIFLVILAVAIAGLNAGIFVWKTKKVTPATVTTQQVQVAQPAAEPPAKETPVETPSLDTRWGKLFPNKHKQVPGREEK